MLRTLVLSAATLVFTGFSVSGAALPSHALYANANHAISFTIVTDTHHSLPLRATRETLSENWAGLVQVGSEESSITSSWTTPTSFTSTPSSNSAVAEWIGLGGFQTTSLIQVGTITTPDGAGSPVTTVFWENLPAAATEGVTIPAGTTVTASITPTGQDQWTLTLTDGGSTPLVDQVVNLTPAEANAVATSADWITEAPTAGNQVVPLAPIASTTMQDLTANGDDLTAMPTNSLETIGLQNGAATALPTVNASADTLTVSVSNTPTIPTGNIGQSGYPFPGQGGHTPWNGGHHGWNRGWF